MRAVLAGYRKSDPPMQRSFALVRIETDDGTIGWGEASTNWGHSYPTVFRAVVDDVCARHLVGRDPLAIRDRLAELSVALDGYLGWEGVTSQTIGSIEIALWDIAGKALDAPVHQLLGSTAHPIPLYGTGTTMFEESAEWHAHYFDQCLALGFAGVKVRLGRQLDDDVEVVRVVREHIGPEPLMGVDSYWFHDPDTAIELSQRIAPYRIYFFEEPIPQYQIEGLERVQRGSPVRVAVGERVYSPRSFAELARRERGAGVRTRRHDRRRDPGVPPGRRHRRPPFDRGDPSRRWSRPSSAWRPTSIGQPRHVSGSANTTSIPTNR